MTDIQFFKNLHQGESPVFIGNVWNVQSAKVYEELGFKALATSSSAVAKSLGYEDGEQMSFDEYFYMIQRISQCTSVPLSVDLESGYGKTAADIVDNIKRLSKIGVVGINIEDSAVTDGIRTFSDLDVFSDKLKSIISQLKQSGIEMFINVRTDPFLLNVDNALHETLQRIKLFDEVGVDGIFVPCITSESDIKQVVDSTNLPLNVMCMPELPDFEVLANLGVKRITSGNFLNGYIYQNLKNINQAISSEKSFSPVFL